MQSNSRERLVILCGGGTWYQSGNVEPVAKPTKAPIKSKSTIKIAPKIIYDVFDKASEYCTINIWKTIFQQAAMGIFRKEFSFSVDTLTFKDKRKIVQLLVDMEDPLIAYKEVKKFMKENGGIYTEEDDEIFNRNTEEEKKEITSWSQVAKRSIDKVTYINEFVNKFDNLSALDKRRLTDLIMLGICSCYFNKDNIKVADNEIKNINGLITTNDGKYKIDVENIKLKNKNKRKNAGSKNSVDTCCTTEISTLFPESEDQDEFSLKIDFYKKWNNFLEYLGKKQVKY